MIEFNLKQYLEEHRQLIEEKLKQFLPNEQEWPQTLHQAMLYSIQAGGKRIRPILTLAACETVGASIERAIPVAIGLEVIHTYSLIHDDLPAMDDDDLRRGKPTNHKKFGEAIAILAGDALLTEAFHLMSSHRHPEVDPVSLLEVIASIAEAAGSKGMAGGQVVDLESEKKKIDLTELEKLHQHKTGHLIRTAVEAGGKLAGAGPAQLNALSLYGERIGLAFQIADDLLDIEGGEEIGKDLGSDIANEKATYPSLIGIESSKKLAHTIIEEAIQSLKIFDKKADPLREIAQYIVNRKL